MSTPSSAQQHDLMAYLSTNPDGTVEDIAKRYNVTPLDVIRLTPGAQIFDGAQFDTVWDEITQWGDVTTLVNNDDLILEFHGELPTGTHRHGFFNLRGKKGPQRPYSRHSLPTYRAGRAPIYGNGHRISLVHQRGWPRHDENFCWPR